MVRPHHSIGFLLYDEIRILHKTRMRLNKWRHKWRPLQSSVRLITTWMKHRLNRPRAVRVKKGGNFWSRALDGIVLGSVLPSCSSGLVSLEVNMLVYLWYTGIPCNFTKEFCKLFMCWARSCTSCRVGIDVLDGLITSPWRCPGERVINWINCNRFCRIADIVNPGALLQTIYKIHKYENTIQTCLKSLNDATACIKSNVFFADKTRLPILGMVKHVAGLAASLSPSARSLVGALLEVQNCSARVMYNCTTSWPRLTPPCFGGKNADWFDYWTMWIFEEEWFRF